MRAQQSPSARSGADHRHEQNARSGAHERREQNARIRRPRATEACTQRYGNRPAEERPIR